MQVATAPVSVSFKLYRMLRSIMPLIVAAMVISSCSGNRARVNTYTDPSFDQTTIKSIAILPMRNSQIALSDSMMINRTLAEHLHRSRQDISIVGPEESVNALNEANLTDAYSAFLSTYYTSGIPNRKTLLEMGKALNADAIMQGGVIEISQADGNGWDREATARATVKYSLISTKKGSIIWDSTAEGQAWTEMKQAPSIIDTVGPAINKIFEGFPLAPTKQLLPKYSAPAEQNPAGQKNRR